MDDCTRVLVYGSFDGFAYSTDDSLLISVVLDGGEKVEIPEEFIVSADQMVNKYKIKLKDVIARIKKLDLDAQKVWLNEILNELGSDYGTLKYKSGYEQGRLEGEWVGQQLKDADKIRQELNKPVVKQFVADWYEEHKDDFEYEVWDWISSKDEPEKIHSEFAYWINDVENNPIQTLVNMHQFGYTVEKEKRYRVKAKGVGFNSCLIFEKINKTWFFSSIYETDHQRGNHTRKELEEAGFGEVFNSPLFEVKEAE